MTTINSHQRIANSPYFLYVLPAGNKLKIKNNKITLIIDFRFFARSFNNGTLFFAVPTGAKWQKGINMQPVNNSSTQRDSIFLLKKVVAINIPI